MDCRIKAHRREDEIYAQAQKNRRRCALRHDLIERRHFIHPATDIRPVKNGLLFPAIPGPP